MICLAGRKSSGRARVDTNAGAIGAIAEELRLSVKTISSYRTNILLKTKMKNNAEITHYAIKKSLVD